MQINLCTVDKITQIGKITFLIKVHSPEIASAIKPGQFCNIKVSETNYPLLRRPFSICDVENESICFMFDLVGEGTKILSEKNKGDKLDILGPLGRGFTFENKFENIVLVAGGIGLAPFPFLIKKMIEKNIVVYFGARNKEHLINYNLHNLQTATDDGSFGFHGNVIQLLEKDKKSFDKKTTMFYACGPTPMLAAFQKFCIENDFMGEISTESAMACGFGICQGCPIETTADGYYKLICKDGPVFDLRDVKL